MRNIRFDAISNGVRTLRIVILQDAIAGTTKKFN